MANIICGISGVPFKTPHIPMTLHKREMNHPIFYLPQKRLLGIYSLYLKGQLTDIDSYLLFVALLKSTDNVTFSVITQVSTSTERIIASNIRQLVEVIWETNAILHPSFKQPSFYISQHTANLDNIKMWIVSWRKNIEEFKSGIDSRSSAKKLLETEKRLERLILSPDITGDLKLLSAVANWASLAADFPIAKMDDWKLLIRKCYNMQSMFNTPKKDLIELKEYCEENIEAGSLYYHNLMKVLRTGIANHNDFLGLGYLTSDPADKSSSYNYTLLDTPENEAKGEAAILAIIASAPTSEPIKNEYKTLTEFLKAKLAYRAAQEAGMKATSPSPKKEGRERSEGMEGEL